MASKHQNMFYKKKKKQETTEICSRGGLGVATNTGSSTIIVHSTVKTNFVPFAGSGFKLGAGESNTAVKSRQKNNPKKQIKTDRPQVHQIRIEDSDSDGELNSDSIISCPVCNRSIHLRNIESHLEECKKLDSGFYNTIIIDSDNETETAGKPNSVKCPCCATLVNENKINEHLDICLQ
ncbi:hypothetical protein AAG570_006823 [Ranatra chinensis]|uniref:UBZ4-type domain-containing protein n=1 Tax=Ranatra chinensis TaxID=642074 RepID=A0ABD0YV73_9HEMI